jgi:glycosyltransferase involved in cell wall biosynthesis
VGQDNAAPKTLVLASSRTLSGTREAICAGERPRLDYLELVDALGGDVLDTQISEEQPPWKRRVEQALASDFRQAQAAWQRRGSYDAFLSTSERVGLPLAFAQRTRGRGRGPAHVMIGHVLTSERKKQIQRLTNVFHWGFSSIICLSSTQEYYLLDQVGLPSERVHKMLHHVDTEFYCPQEKREEGYILAVGRENRDYATLIAAARLCGLPVKIVASSLWAIRGGQVADDNLPGNITVHREFVPFLLLRELYAGARAVVVPLHESEYAAGSTGLLEGLAMGKPVIVSAAKGLADYLADPKTHRAVAVGDAAMLAQTMTEVWDDEEGRSSLAVTGRQLAVSNMSLEGYVAGVTEVVRRAVEEQE